MWRLADQQLDEFIADGRCEFISAYTQPFAMLVVADLLGVPEEDHQRFREGFGLSGRTRRDRWRRRTSGMNALGWLDEWFAAVHRGPAARAPQGRADRLGAGHLPRRVHARGDVRSCGRRPSCSPPGRRRPPGSCAVGLKYLAEHPELQDELRADTERIPDFIEEALRIESPVKSDFRLARRSTTVGGVDIAAGTPVMLLNGAANRDPRRFECPDEFRLDRPNAQVHMAFGRGVHCLPRRAVGPGRGPGQHRAHPRPHARHPPLRGAPRAAVGPPLPVRAHLDPARPHQAAPRVHPGRGASDGRVAVVTGAASGIGLGVAQQLAADGHRVALLDRTVRGARRPRPTSCAAEGATAIARRGRRRRPRGRSSGCSPRCGAELGPVEILVTSAGIESFDAVADITAGEVGPDPGGEPDRHLHLRAGGRAGHAGRAAGAGSSPSPRRARNRARRTWRTTWRPRAGSSASRRRWRGSSPATGSPSTPSRRASSTRPWPGRPRRRERSRASTSWAAWSRSAGPGPPPTSPPRARSSARTAASYITGQLIGVNGGMYI